MSVESIGEYAFNGCSGFKDHVLTIPKGNSLKSIGTNAFGSCWFEKDKGANATTVWIAIDPSNSGDQAKLSEYGFEVGKTYFYDDTYPRISEAANTSQTKVTGDPFYGYQLPYGFFERIN